MQNFKIQPMPANENNIIGFSIIILLLKIASWETAEFHYSKKNYLSHK